MIIFHLLKNGLFRLPAYGLSDCVWGQGFGEARSRYRLTGNWGRLAFVRHDVPNSLLIPFAVIHLTLYHRLSR